MTFQQAIVRYQRAQSVCGSSLSRKTSCSFVKPSTARHAELGASTDIVDDLKLAVTEACSNVVKYAYRGSSGELDVSLDPVENGFNVFVQDSGSWLNRDEDDGEAGGLGIPLMEAVTRAFELDSNGQGTTVRLEFALHRSKSARVQNPAMADQATAEQSVDVSIGDPRFSAAVLERLVSAAAARADLPIDRVVNAMTLVDALVYATDSVLGDGTREIRVTIGDGSLGLRIDSLVDGQAEAIRDAAQLPEVGDVLGRTASTVAIEHDGVRSALVMCWIRTRRGGEPRIS